MGHQYVDKRFPLNTNASDWALEISQYLCSCNIEILPAAGQAPRLQLWSLLSLCPSSGQFSFGSEVVPSMHFLVLVWVPSSQVKVQEPQADQ